MTKAEIIKALDKWSDDAQVELAIPVDLDSDEPMMEDKVWPEIKMIEETNSDPLDDNKHCLILAARLQWVNYVQKPNEGKTEGKMIDTKADRHDATERLIKLVEIDVANAQDRLVTPYDIKKISFLRGLLTSLRRYKGNIPFYSWLGTQADKEISDLKNMRKELKKGAYQYEN